MCIEISVFIYNNFMCIKVCNQIKSVYMILYHLILNLIVQFQKISIPNLRRFIILEIPKGRGSQKPKCLQASKNQNRNFQRGLAGL